LINHSKLQQEKTERIDLPFKRDYEIVFHENEPFKFNLTAETSRL